MKLFKCLLVAALLVSLSSCSITERIIFKEDGSGKFAYEIDGSKMMSMMGDAFKDESAKKSKKKKNKKGERESLDMDSTFTFRELFAEKKDSIAKLPLEEQEKLKKMENFSMRMVMNEAKGTLNYTMFTDFKSIAELKDIMSPMQSMKSLGSSNKSIGEKGSMMNDDNTNEYFYDGKLFQKKVSKLPIDNSNKDAETIREEDELAQSMKESMAAVYEESEFKVVYQFPKAVKKVSNPNAVYSDGRKTVTVLFDMKEYMETPESLNLEIELE